MPLLLGLIYRCRSAIKIIFAGHRRFESHLRKVLSFERFALPSFLFVCSQSPAGRPESRSKPKTDSFVVVRSHVAAEHFVCVVDLQCHAAAEHRLHVVGLWPERLRCLPNSSFHYCIAASFHWSSCRHCHFSRHISPHLQFDRHRHCRMQYSRRQPGLQSSC